MNKAPHPISQLQTLAELFNWRVSQTPDTAAYRQYDQAAQCWQDFSWQQMSTQVEAFARALGASGVMRGDRVAILLPNGTDAVCADQASLKLACVPVPMHALDNPESIAYILKDSDAAVLICTTDLQWRDIAGTGVVMPALRQVVIQHKILDTAVPGTILLADWLSSHRQAALPDFALPAADELATVVYTSGTTGKPKGVMLSHGNVLSNVKAVVQRMAPVAEDVFLSFLPLSHTFERTAGYYLPMAAGCCVAYSRSTKQLPEDLKQIRPTILISVPRIYERVYSVIQTQLAAAPLKRSMFDLAAAAGWRRYARQQKLPVDGGLGAVADQLLCSLLHPLVAKQLQAQFGGRLRVAVSGGAALSATISHCFLGLGIPIIQGYGMTETAPVVAFNAPDDNDPASVGRVVQEVEVRIGENNELQVRGPNVMRGYWKREEDTAKAFIDGWLRTGDQAAVIDGRVKILGRVKEIIVTSTGEKIAPVDLEMAITSDPVFEQAYAFGENAPFIACAVVISQSWWKQLATETGCRPDDLQALNSKAVTDQVIQRIKRLTQSFPYYAQPRAVIVSLEPWSVENTLITPTLKLKRNNLAKHFEADMQRIYLSKKQ